MINTRLTVAALATLLAATSAQAIELGQIDTFDDGAMACTTNDWFEPGQSPNPPTAEAFCGDAGSCCLSATSSGVGGPGSRQVILNEDQWVGDYVAEGVTAISLLGAASSDASINLRVGITNGQTCFVSSNAVLLSGGTPGLVSATFALDEASMEQVFGNNCGIGTDSLATVLSGVIQLRLISSEQVSWLGDRIDSGMQLDMIAAEGATDPDTDGDGVSDLDDNCTLVVNADQTDSDTDGYGNACDSDLNNDCIVNVIDLGLLRSVFFTADANADFNGDGVVNVIDLGILRTQFFGEPGPGLGVCGS
ncbi:MAG: thrombospondin type 3 repeat-containing protein [Gammaproteobacteria bacterium]